MILWIKRRLVLGLWSVHLKCFLNIRNTETANRLTILPYRNAIVGLIASQRRPAIKLDGNAIRPVKV